MAAPIVSVAGLFRLALTAAIYVPLFLMCAERLGNVGLTPGHVFPHPFLLGTLIYPACATAMILVWLDGRSVHTGIQRVVLSLICLIITAIAIIMWSFVIEGGIAALSDLRYARYRVTSPYWLSHFLMLGSLPFVYAIYRSVDMLPAPLGSAQTRRLRQQSEGA